MVLASDSRYCGSRNSGYVGVCTWWKNSPSWNSPSRNGVSVLMKCTWWPRAASALPSSVATMPLPPTEA
jgi:hypothetical protein